VFKDSDGKAEIHYTTVYKVFARWSDDGSLEQAFIVRANIAEPEPAAIGTGGIRTEMVGGDDVATAAPCRDQRRWRGAGRLPARCDALFTGVTVGFMSETQKGFGLFGALVRWRDERSCSLLLGRPSAWPYNMQYEEQP